MRTPIELYPDHTATIQTLDPDIALHLRGLGEAWAAVFDVVEGRVSPTEGWSRLKIIRLLHVLEEEIEPAPTPAGKRKRKEPATAGV